MLTQIESPSSRRAWIEIKTGSAEIATVPVALLAEGVDRNRLEAVLNVRDKVVALLAEGVDRNVYAGPSLPHGRCRPPRGGRG